jgi:hypothetical protein
MITQGTVPPSEKRLTLEYAPEVILTGGES